MKSFVAALLATLMLCATPQVANAAACNGTCAVGQGNSILSGTTVRKDYTRGSSRTARSVGHRPLNPGYLGNGRCIAVLVRDCFDPLSLFSPFLGGFQVGIGFLPPGQRAARPALPQIGGYQVLAAFRRIPLPAPASVSQPAGKTLVNFDTIFYTRAAGFQRRFALLGRQITLDVTPSQYTWAFGDGQRMTTTSAGGPYPDKSVTHRYQDGQVTVDHRVTVIWSARFRVDGGAWRAVPGTATSTGAPTGLRVAEATPVLTGSY